MALAVYDIGNQHEITWEVLVSRLVARGISLAQIPTLVRNVLGIIGNGGLFTTRMINEQLG
jgi:hypothetical protein